MQMERVGWIDFLRGFAMILILAFHTEVYYKDYYTPYYIYTTNAVILFYFISGYLFFRHETFDYKKRIKSIVRSLLIPYFIFTTLIAVPKILVRHDDINLIEILTTIITGRASWFIAALIVAEVVFSILLWLSRGKHIWLTITAILCFISYYLVPFHQHNYWQWQDALLAFDFLYIGYVYHQYKIHFNNINKPLYSFILLFILIVIKIYEYHIHLPMRNIAIESAPLFLLDSFVWLLLIVSIINYIPRFHAIEWTGQHSIVYYFLCGGCPLIVSLLMNKIGLPYDGYLWRFLLVFVLVYSLTTCLTYLIYKYVPFLIGKR